MTFSAFIDKIRERAEVRFACEPSLIYDILDEIESEVTERIEELEASIEGYERLLDRAYDDFYAAVDNGEVREVLKELIEYAPRKNWEEK